MNLVSYSLYGDKPIYTFGAIENAKFWHRSPGDWNAIFYCDFNTDPSVIKVLQDYSATVVIREKDWHPNGMFWRFRVFRDFDFDFAIIRDVDSRISQRELDATSEWQGSGKCLHIMRDHPYHKTQILGGMWGASKEINKIRKIWELERQFLTGVGQDQYFLRDYIYPALSENSRVHDSFFKFERDRYSFPSSRIDFEYVGESFDENNNFNPELRRVIQKYESSKLRKLYLKIK